MYNNVLLFGARGHLARTKVIPALKSKKMNYVSLSRQKVTNLQKYQDYNNIAYMSIPTQHFFECIEPYEDFINQNKPLFVIEKPHGIDQNNFMEIDDYFAINDFHAVYNDHYIAKDSVLNINKIESLNVRDIFRIDIKLHESACVNDRLEYFDKVGIILDMYQSHVLIILSTLLAHLEQIPRVEVLRHIAKCIPYHKQLSKYSTYKGTNFTKCELTFIYKGIIINVSCGKKLTDEKHLCLYTDNQGYHCIDLSNSKGNPYEQIFTWLRDDEIYHFLSSEEIVYLWKHVGLF